MAKSQYATEKKYESYSLDTSDEEARKLFQKKYGTLPEKVFRNAALVMAGPIEQEKPATYTV